MARSATLVAVWRVFDPDGRARIPCQFVPPKVGEQPREASFQRDRQSFSTTPCHWTNRRNCCSPSSPNTCSFTRVTPYDCQSTFAQHQLTIPSLRGVITYGELLLPEVAGGLPKDMGRACPRYVQLRRGRLHRFAMSRVRALSLPVGKRVG